MYLLKNLSLSKVDGAAHALSSGNLVAFPTETVYGLGADATNEKAIRRLYEIKNRPHNHPVIVHVSSAEKLELWAQKIPTYAFELSIHFWPGPLTLILPRTKLAKDFVTGGQESVGIRIPSHSIAQSLLTKFEEIGGYGVVAPSANLFGQVSPTTKRAVLIELGHLLHDSDVVINGGNCQIGIESTIIDCTQVNPIILRHGAVTLEQIKIVLPDIQVASEHLRRGKSFSGKFQSHYSPNAKVYLNGVAQKGDGLIALSNFKTPRGAIRLAAPKNNDEFAKCLYEAFRKADSFRLNKIYVITPSGFGIARAINERLIKAAYKTFRG